MDRYIPTIGIYEKCNISPVWNMGLIYWFASSGPRLQLCNSNAFCSSAWVCGYAASLRRAA